MGNAQASAITDQNDGEDYNEAREEQHRPERSGENNDIIKQTCLSEQNKTISFNVQLLCASHNSTTAIYRTFTARKFPESVAALKLAIQEGFQVPVYDQKLSFGCTVMADGESLDFYRLKDGDQITLEYTTTVDVECAFRLMSLLRNALEFIKNEQSQLATSKISPKNIADTLRVEDIKQCIDQLADTDEKADANFKFLLNNGGLDVITSLHSLLLKQTWDKIRHLDLQRLENYVLLLLKGLYSSIVPHMRSELVCYLSNIFGSFLRVPISSDEITVPHNPNLPASTKPQQLQVLSDVLFNALFCLLPITLEDHHQLQIISNQRVMKQLIGCLKTPTFTTHMDIVVLCCLHNLTYNAYTHKYLSNVDLIGAIMKVADRTPSEHIQFEDMDPVLCLKLESDLAKYFGVMVISHLALTKAALLPEKLTSQIELFLNNFLHSVGSDVDFKLFCMWMLKARGIKWRDLFPPLRLVYSPLHYTSLCPIDSLCLEAAVMRLHIILSKDNKSSTLIKQDVLDYLVCLPWHISEGLEAHKRAKLLLEMVGSNMPLQPPSLNNIVRAKLAASWCGLEEAMSSQLVGFCQEIVAASSRQPEGHVQTTA